MVIEPAPCFRRRSPRARAATLAALLLVASPGIAAAAAPVAVDDPSDACGNAGFGGAFPIPEDFTGGTAGFETWFYLFGSCGPLANDTDADGDPLSWSVVDEPPNGEVIKVDEDSFGYRPDPDYSTVAGDEPGGTWFSDAFTYRANDGTTDSGLAAYRFWITPINDPPSFVAGADVAVAEGSGAYSAPWATAISPGPANEAGQTVRFDVEVDDEDLFLVAPAVASDGVLTFTPGTSAGIAMATVRAIDDGGLTDYGLPDGMMIPPDDTSDPVTFQIVISHAPRAIDDELTIDEDAGPWLIDVLANDDPAGPVPLTITAVTEPTKGVADVAPDASAVVYTPHADSWGTDTFSYTTDAGPSATVTVTVTPVNDAPVGDTDHFVVLKDAGPVPLDVLDGDIDVDDSALVISSAVNGRGGTVVVAPDRRSLTFRPKPGRTGRTLFTYVVADPGGLRDAVTVYVDVVVPTALAQARTGTRR